MKITDVTIRNFLTIGDDPIKLNLDSKGMVLIMGDNRDDSSAISNGAGKSTIGDAICWALYGVTARGETGDDIVNNTIGKNCCVEVFIEDDGVVYSIARYRKDKAHKNSLQVTQAVTNPVAAANVLTKGTDKLTQDLVNKIVGCSYEVFKSAIYAAQDSIPNLPGMTDKNLKEIVEEAAGINRLAEAHLLARDELKTRENSVVVASTGWKNTMELIANVDSELSDMRVSDAGFDANRNGKMMFARNKINALTIMKGDIDDEIARFDKADLNKQLIDLDNKLNDFIAKKKIVDDEERTAAKTLTSTEGLFRASVHKLKSDIAKLESIEDRIGKPCGECGKDYCEEDLESAAEIAKQEVAKSKQAAAALKVTLTAHKLAHDDALTAVNALGNITAAVSANKTAADAIRGELKRLSDYEKMALDATNNIASLETEVTDLLAATSPYAEMITKSEAKLAKLKLDEIDFTNREASAIVARDLSADAVKVFSPAGVRAHIIDTVTPFLNDRTSHYLSALSDGNISAVWNTLSKTKTGELREKFVIEVSNDKGASKFGGLSGGEKRKVRIATALALQDLVASRASKPISLWVADEIDDALDNAGLERLMMLLEEKAREKGTVLMISHNSLGDWASAQAVMIKEGGFSRMEGALVI